MVSHYQNHTALDYSHSASRDAPRYWYPISTSRGYYRHTKPSGRRPAFPSASHHHVFRSPKEPGCQDHRQPCCHRIVPRIAPAHSMPFAESSAWSLCNEPPLASVSAVSDPVATTTEHARKTAKHSDIEREGNVRMAQRQGRSRDAKEGEASMLHKHCFGQLPTVESSLTTAAAGPGPRAELRRPPRGSGGWGGGGGGGGGWGGVPMAGLRSRISAVRCPRKPHFRWPHFRWPHFRWSRKPHFRCPREPHFRCPPQPNFRWSRKPHFLWSRKLHFRCPRKPHFC
jgi:hypothetical protein